jgi:hypothetical protein
MTVKTLRRQLAAAIAMTLVSTVALGSSTYAWFTMNREVSVTGMEVKAHSEEGLLINEVKAANSLTWDDAATAGTNTVALRPASTSDLTNWWHANSKVSNEEAGIGELNKTVSDSSGNYYANVSASNTSAISDQTIVYDEASTSQTDYATGNTKAETHVYYKDASFGTDSQYDDGEGFYVKYIYYLKSSGDEDLVVSDLQARVKAYAKAGDTGDTANLMKALRVGIEVPASNANDAARAGFGIFAPVPGADNSYSVTNNAAGTASTSVNAVDATTLGTPTDYTTLNITTTGETPTTSTITIPDVNDSGIPVYVYVWFEGEDNACTSDNLLTVLSTYDVDIDFAIGQGDAY